MDFFLINDDETVMANAADGFRELAALCGECLKV
jgi:hypothetical protein